MVSTFNETFLFLTKLAWNCRIILPMLVTVAFMAMDFRMAVEINIQTERIMVQEEPFMVMEVGEDEDSSWETVTEDEVESEDDDYESDDFSERYIQ